MLEPRQLLAKLDLTEAEIDIYLAMLGGALSARDLGKVSGRSRPTVYYVLSTLEHRGLISKTGLGEDHRYRVEPVQRLATMVQQKQTDLHSLQAGVTQFIEQMQTAQAGDGEPQVAFYEGVTGVRNVSMETIYCHSRSIDTIVPTENFFWQLGSDFVEQYVRLRHDLGVRTRNLWGTTIAPDVIEKYYDKSEVRLLADGLGDKFRSTVFMYDDSVLYISSLASGYALLVKSPEHYEMMQAFYEVMWTAGKPLKSPK
jgi:sugar-specific transcriptional regulator TrmB